MEKAQKYFLATLVLLLIWIVGILVAVSVPLSLLMGNYKRAKNLFTALDQLNNAALDGDPDETISSRCGKKLMAQEECKWCEWLCRTLDWGEKGHCKKAIDMGEGRNEVRFFPK